MKEVGMPIENRNLVVGTRLVAKYKKVSYLCEVVETDAGVRYRLDDGRAFKSPSAAGTAVLGGQACNGWRFWSVVADGPQNTVDEPQIAEPTVSEAQPKPRLAGKVIKRVPNQQGVPEGQTRWFCAGCADSFSAEGNERPNACPKGHGANLDENGDLVTVATSTTPE
jgi:hypothetical protein